MHKPVAEHVHRSARLFEGDVTENRFVFAPLDPPTD